MGPAGAPTLSGLIVSQEIIDGVCAPFDDLMQDSMDPLLYQFFPELEGLESPTAIAAQTPSSSLHDGDLLAYMDELEGGNKDFAAPDGAPPATDGPSALTLQGGVTVDQVGKSLQGPLNEDHIGEHVTAPVLQVAHQPAPSSCLPSSTLFDPQDSRPVVPPPRGLRTKSSSFSISPSFRNMNTDAMKVFLRFYHLYERKLIARADEDGPSAICVKQVKRDTAIRDILLSRKGDRHLRELLTQDLLQQPRQLRGTTSYYIGCNGLWLMQQSGLQSRGGANKLSDKRLTFQPDLLSEHE